MGKPTLADLQEYLDRFLEEGPEMLEDAPPNRLAKLKRILVLAENIT